MRGQFLCHPSWIVRCTNNSWQDLAKEAQLFLQLGQEASPLSKCGQQALGTIATTNARYGGVPKQGPRRRKRVDSQG